MNSINQQKNDFSLNNKTVIITGVSGQLGSELAKKYLECGAFVIGIDKLFKKKFLSKHKNFIYYKVDLTEVKEIKSNFKKIINNHKKIDILINNAGLSFFEHFTKRSEKKFNETINVMNEITTKMLREDDEGNFDCIVKINMLINI